MDEKYVQEMSVKRRIRTQALAILQRANRAGIPIKWQRIGAPVFSKLLCEKYHNKIEDMVKFVYDTPLELKKKSFVVIDGGTDTERYQIGFAILFRLIACDSIGKYVSGKDICHQLESIKLNRSEIANELKTYDTLFIGEITKNSLNTHFDGGSFLDEILEFRKMYDKLTIISFQEPLSPYLEYQLDQVVYGNYLSSIYASEKNKSQNILRIHAKVEE